MEKTSENRSTLRLDPRYQMMKVKGIKAIHYLKKMKEIADDIDIDISDAFVAKVMKALGTNDTVNFSN